MNAVTDHRSLVDALGGNKAVADHLSVEIGEAVPPVRIGQWKMGNRIPPEYWLALIALAAAKNVRADSNEPISTDWLTRTIRPRANAAASEPTQ